MSADAAPVPVPPAASPFGQPSGPSDDERTEALARRVAMLEAGARALYWRHLGRVGRSRLPVDFEGLHPHTREQFLIDALRCLQAAGVLPP